MRILHTCLRYPPATGGVETYVKELVTRTKQDSRYQDVRVLTSALRTHHPASALNPNLLLDDPPYVQRLFYTTTPFLAYPRLQSLKYYLAHHQPDIIHGYSFWYQPADTAARFAAKRHIPFIFHPMYYSNQVRQKLRWQLYSKTIGHGTFARADAVVVISPHEQKLITQAGFPVKRFHLIPPGIDLVDFAQLKPNIFDRLHITGPILLSVSRLASGKGLSDLLSAMPDILKEHPRTHLVLVGEDFGYLKNLQRQASHLGINQHVHFTGQLKRNDLISAYQHADILVHPSHYEAFGIVLAEALAAQTPVVARNVAAIPYVAPHRTASLLFNNKTELTSHIRKLLTDKQLSQQLATQGQVHIKNSFTWDQSIKKVISLYQSIAN